MEYLKEQNILKTHSFRIRPEDIYDTPTTEQFAESKAKVKAMLRNVGCGTLVYSIMFGQEMVAKIGARIDIHMGTNESLWI